MPERRIGKFELLDELGQGGMGVVYRARDTRLNRLVALKLLLPDRHADELSRGRFLRECRAVAALNHPNIATLYEADETADGTLYFAAELVDGETLANALSRGPVPLERGLAFAMQLADALSAAHDKGIVHRDIKPANLMITPEGHLKVLDFGLAHLSTQREPLEPDAPTRADSAASMADFMTIDVVVGTPGYMAPEQIRGERIGPPADVFAAGIVLYELATGERPFSGLAPHERLWQIVNTDPPPASEVNPRVPASLSAVIARCLQKDPDGRFRSGAELREALARCHVTKRRVRWWIGGAAAAGVAAAAAGIWWSPTDTLAFSSQDRILIADVSNETSEPAFSGALGTALEVDLRQSQYAIVVGRKEISEVFQLTRRSPDTRLDLKTALDVARWAGAKAVLAPSVTQVGSTYRLAASLYATETASPVESVSVLADSKDAVLRNAVDQFTAAVRERLGESLPEIKQTDAPVVVVTTASWEALEALHLGLDAVDQRRNAEAAAFLEEALRRDPEFAAAKGQLGLILIQFLNQTERGKKLLGEAASSADRLSNFERVMLKALMTQFVDGNLEAALQDFRVAATLFPSRPEPHQNQGVILRALARYKEAITAFNEAHRLAPKSAGPLGLMWFLQTGPARDPIGAEATSRQLLALRPDDADFGHMLGWSYVTQQRFDDAEKQLESVLAAHPDHARARVNFAHLALRRGDGNRAVERYEGILHDARAGRIQQNSTFAAVWLAVALQVAGRRHEADTLLADTLATAKTPATRALLHAMRGRRNDALKGLRALPELRKLDSPNAVMVAATHAFLDDRDRALETLAHALRLNARDPYYFLIRPDFRPLWGDERFIRLVTTGK